MFRNYVKIALRNVHRQKGYTAINVFGLAVGMACCLLIGLYVRDELSYDHFHTNADRIVRMATDFVTTGEVDEQTVTQGLLAPAMEADLPDVEHAVRLIGWSGVFNVDEERFQEDGLVYADANFFELFSFPLLRGDKRTALTQPNSIVITKTLALIFFGKDDPVGQTIYNNDKPFTVTGVMADVPRQSHVQFDAVISLNTLSDPGWFYTNWFSVNFRTYVLLREGTDLAAFRAKLPAFIAQRAGDEMREMKQQIVLHAEPITDVYLRSERTEAGERGNAAALAIFGAVALFVLLIACVNFTNLATAQSVTRAKEVGVRKTLGAARRSLAAQFLAEAVLLSTFALGIALGMVKLSLPAFNAFADKTLALGDLGVWLFSLAGLVVLVGLLAGAYPALVLSGFRPAEVLKGQFSSGRQGIALRRGLVMLQFGISVALIASTGIVFQQLRYMQTRDLGFDNGDTQEQLLTLNFGGNEAVQSDLAAIKRRFLNHPAVTGVTSSLSIPAAGHAQAGGVLERPDGSIRDFGIEAYLVDTSFVSVYGLEILAGQAPSEAVTSDSLIAYVLNETAVRKAGYPNPNSILGKQATFWGYKGEVVGVMRDFHTSGLQMPVEPLGLVATNDFQQYLTLRVQTADLATTLPALEAIWKELAPQRPFTYTFLDDAFAAQYLAEQQFGRLFGMLSMLAILIACLGLFGLAAHTAAQRTKEIGIRKVLGASIPNLVRLLTQDVVVLVTIAFCVAAPLAYLGMERWLGDFAYRIDISWPIFVMAGLLVLAIALLTVSYQAIKTAVADPVKSLRYE